MAETVPVNENEKQNQINIFKISPFPTDDTLKMPVKIRNQLKIDALQTNGTFRSVSHDRYLD